MTNKFKKTNLQLIKKSLLNNKILILILLTGFFLRIYKYDQLFMYSHDQDLAGWIIRDIVENRHLRLIGQETSNQGVFIGPLFYYLLIPFYFLTNWDPIGGVFLSLIIGLSTILSIFFVVKSIINKNAGLIASFIYSISFYTVFTDREVVPTTPAMLWSVWYFYALHLLLKGKQKWGFLLGGILIGLIWHINLALILVTPLIFLALVLARRKISIKYALLGVATTLVLSLPFIAFELRHGFQQIESIIGSLTTNKNLAEGTLRGLPKLDRTMQLVYKNIDSLFIPSITDYAPLGLILLFILGLYIWMKKKGLRKYLIISVAWILLFIAFFTLNSLNLSEYYLNGMNIIYIFIVSALGSLFISKKRRMWVLLVLLLFAFIQIPRTLGTTVNKSGYIERKQIIKFIKEDAKLHGYPCVSISYITSPGNNLGYRYLIYKEGLHANQPKSGSPVYTIVYPHRYVDRIDRSFGALGLVLPDYERYNKQAVDITCIGPNANLTDPMFGFLK